MKLGRVPKKRFWSTRGSKFESSDHRFHSLQYMDLDTFPESKFKFDPNAACRFGHFGSRIRKLRTLRLFAPNLTRKPR